MKNIGYRGLQWKIMSIIIGFSVIPLLALGYFITHQFTSTYEERIIRQLRTIVENQQRAIDIFLEERIIQLITLLHTHTPEELSDERELSRYFQIMQSQSQSFIDLGFINQQGRHEAYVGPYSIEDFDYSEEDWFQEVMLKRLFISDVFMGYRKFPHFIIAVMYRAEGRSWILRATIDSNIFNNLVGTVQAGDRGDAFLLNRDMVLQTTSRFSGSVLSRVDIPRMDPFTGSKITRITIDNENRIAGFKWLQQTNWLLVVTEDPEEEMSPLLQTKWLMFLMVIIGVLVIITGAFLITSAIVRKMMAADREKALLDASLMQSSKMAALGKLASGVAHELNNPLTMIRENAGWMKDLLEEETPSHIKHYDDLRKVAGKIEFHVDRARDVTHRMLGFGRRMEPVHEDVSLNLVTEQTLKFLQQEALYRNIEIKKNLRDDLPNITTDINQLQQVILNILDNSLDAIGKDGLVFLKTGTMNWGQEVYLEVADSGPGIPKETLQKIFDPFFTTKAPGEGTGLGLAICFTIMEKLGGRIEVESELGKGSVFRIILPSNIGAGETNEQGEQTVQGGDS